MGILENIKGYFEKHSSKIEKATPIDVDKDGMSLYEEDIVAFVKNELERRKTERMPYELQWTLNCNFLAGNQFCDINTHHSNVENYEAPYDYMEHEVYNQIAPLIETRIANLKRIDYLMTVKPHSDDLDDYEKSKVATSILRHIQFVSCFDDRKDNMIHWAELCGTCFIMSWWDNSKGKPIGKFIDTIENSDGEFSNKEQIIYNGDLDYGLLSPFEVYPESIFKENISEQRSIIIEQVMSVEDIFDRYGIDVEGEELDSYTLTPVPGAGGFGYEASVMALETAKIKNSKKVYTYFEKQGRRYPNGRTIIIIGEKIIFYNDLPYDEIPISAIKSKKIAGQFFGKSTIQDLIPLQRAYNGCMNSIHDYIKSLTVGGWIAEDGAIDVDEYMENGTAPGSILTYRKGYNPPRPMDNAALPNEITNECQKLRSDMEYTAGVSQLMVVGSTPTGVTSGTAIQNLREIDNTRLSLTGDNIRNAVIDLSKKWLSIIKKHASGYRVIDSIGKNSAFGAITWCSEDINSFDVVYDTENSLTFSEEQQKATLIEAFNMGLLVDEQGKISQDIRVKMLEYMKINNYSGVLGINDLQLKAAQRENAFIKLGIMPTIQNIDDDSIHITEHKKYALQMDFILINKKNKALSEAFILHIEQHEQALNKKQAEKNAAMSQMNGGVI